MDGMTGKKIVNLINKLEQEVMSSDKIINYTVTSCLKGAII